MTVHAMVDFRSRKVAGDFLPRPASKVLQVTLTLEMVYWDERCMYVFYPDGTYRDGDEICAWPDFVQDALEVSD